MDTTDESRVFRNAVAVEPLGPGHYEVTLSEFYSAGGHLSGGYLQGVMGNAALAAATGEGAHHLHVVAITTNFIGAPVPGPAELRTDVRLVGRGASFVHVTMIQDGAITTESLVTTGTLREDSTARYMNAIMPELAPLDECRQSTGGDEINIMRVVDLRLDPSYARWWSGELSERGEVRGWLRLNDDDSSWGVLSLLFAGDALPPATYPLGSSRWVPTLQLTSYVRRIPVGEWLAARQWCVVIADGVVDERCELFDERGELVASSSQIAMVRFPSGR